MGQVSLAEAKHGSIGYHFENEMWYCGPLKFPWSSKRPLVVEIPLVVETAKIPLDEGTLAVFSELEKLLSNACLIAIQNGIPSKSTQTLQTTLSLRFNHKVTVVPH